MLASLERLRELGTAGDAQAVFIADMLVPVEPENVDPCTGEHHGRGHARYSCRHVDAAGQCTVYEERPDMCREYPYNRPCTFVGCTWTAAREARCSRKGEDVPHHVSSLRLFAKRTPEGYLVRRTEHPWSEQWPREEMRP